MIERQGASRLTRLMVVPLFPSPEITGGRVGLHPFVMIVIFAGMAEATWLCGILIIPLTPALRVSIFRYVWQRAGRAA